MKKIVSIMLCVLMLVGVMATSSFAADIPDEGWKLGEFGQLGFFAGAESDVAPEVDGVVNDGEYSLAIEGMKLEEDSIDERFFVVDRYGAEYVNIYAAHDFDFIYFAVEVKDPSFVHHDGVTFALGLKENIDSSLMFATRFNDVPDDTNMTIDLEELSKPEEDPNNPYWAGNLTSRTGEVYDFVAGKGLTYNEETQIATYEIAFSRLKLEEEAGDILDQLYLRIVVNMRDESGSLGTFWFGFNGDSADLRTKHHSYISRFPHVLYLTEGEGDESYAPTYDEDDDPDAPSVDVSESVATAPVVDGRIGEDEYTQTYSAVVGADDDGWKLIDDEQEKIRAVDAPYANGLRATSWSFASDEDYIYVASSIETSGNTPQAQFYITNGQLAVTYPITTVDANGNVDYGNASWEFEQISTSKEGNKFYFEGKIARSEFGEDADKIYVLGRALCNNAFIFFGINDDYPCGVKTLLADAEAPATDTPDTDEPITDTPVTDDAPVTDNVSDTDTQTVDDGGCGSSIAAVGVALVATLGTCTVFVAKKRD